MKVIVIADQNGKEIVRRRLKDHETHQEVFKQEEEKYYKKLKYGS